MYVVGMATFRALVGWNKLPRVVRNIHTGIIITYIFFLDAIGGTERLAQYCAILRRRHVRL